MLNKITLQIKDMTLVENRLDLINRYNAFVGEPGTQVTALQRSFLTGLMDQGRQIQYVLQCEYMIAARQK